MSMPSARFSTRPSQAGRRFAERQIARLGVVGSNATTAPVIESSYRRLLALLDAHLERHRFVLGDRPATADFALYGQLTQLAGFDPTPRAIALERAPRVVAWIDVLEDLSGFEPRDDGWIERDAVPDSLRALFAEVGRVYAPFLLANADALALGAAQVECAIDDTFDLGPPIARNVGHQPGRVRTAAAPSAASHGPSSIRAAPCDR